MVIVDPPNINRLVLDCEYPDYTNLNPTFAPEEGETPANVKLVDGSQIAEPMETSILMHAAANKPLVGIKVEGQNFRLTVKRERENAEGETLEAFAKFELLARDGVPILELPLAEEFARNVLAPAAESVEIALKKDSNGDGKLSSLEMDAPLREHFPEADKRQRQDPRQGRTRSPCTPACSKLRVKPVSRSRALQLSPRGSAAHGRFEPDAAPGSVSCRPPRCTPG